MQQGQQQREGDDERPETGPGSELPIRAHPSASATAAHTRRTAACASSG
jgi:hypothetical protein